MPASKYALLRYRVIHRCLSNRYNPYPSKEYLRSRCEETLYGTTDGSKLSVKTIERDLRDMREYDALGYHAPVLYSREHNGYYYGDPDYDIDRKPMSPEEKDALAFAANTLYQFREAGIFQPYTFAIEKIFEQFQLKEDEGVAPDNIVQFETVPYYSGSQFLKPIYRAIRQKRSIVVVHRKFTEDQPSRRVIDPYLLKEYRNRWYVTGLDREKNTIRSFGLDRLVEVHLLDETFTQLPSFNPQIYFRHSVGITEAGLAPEEIILSFSPHQGQYIKTQPVHQSQQVLADNEQEFRISLNVLVTYELIQLILGYGNEVVVISPPTLKHEIAMRLSAALNQYR